MIEVTIIQNFIHECCKTPTGWYWRVVSDYGKGKLTTTHDYRYNTKATAKKAVLRFCKEKGYTVDRIGYSQRMV